MLYILISAVVIYFAQRYLIKKLGSGRSRRTSAIAQRRQKHVDVAKSHLYHAQAFRFFEPLDTTKHRFGQKFSSLDVQLVSAVDAACLFIANKLWVHKGHDADTPVREICDCFLDSVANRLKDIESSAAFKALPGELKSSPAQPAVVDYENRGGQANTLLLSDADMQWVYSMCRATGQIIKSEFDQEAQAKMQAIEHIPGAIKELEEFLRKRSADIELYQHVVLLKGYKAGAPLSPEQRLYQIRGIFGGLGFVAQIA